MHVSMSNKWTLFRICKAGAFLLADEAGRFAEHFWYITTYAELEYIGFLTLNFAGQKQIKNKLKKDV